MKKLAVLILSFLIALSACQPAAAPIPLSGARASRLGASALTLQSKPGSLGSLLVPVLADSGKPTPGFAPIDFGEGSPYGFTPSREQLGYISYGPGGAADHAFHLLDLRAWKDSFAPVDLGPHPDTWSSPIAFDAHAQRAAFALNDQTGPASRLIVIDLLNGKVAAQVDLHHNVFDLTFTPGGQIALFGLVKPADQEMLRVAALDPAGLKTAWQQDVPAVHFNSGTGADLSDPTQGRYLSPATVFSPDGARLYVVAADAPTLVTVDFERRSVSSVTIQPAARGSLPLRLLDRLMTSLAGVAHAKMLNGTSKSAVVSKDGQRLFVIGDTTNAVKQDNGEYTMQRIPLGLQVIDTASGVELSKQDVESTFLSIAPDGKTVFLYEWPDTPGAVGLPRTTLLDAGSLKISRALPGEIHATRLLNGELAWLNTQPLPPSAFRLSILAPGSAAPRSQWTVESGYSDWVVVP